MKKGATKAAPFSLQNPWNSKKSDESVI